MLDLFKVRVSPPPPPFPSPSPKKLPYPRSFSYDTIGESRMNPIILATLHFFMSVSRSFQPFLAKHQTDALTISFLGKDLEDLIRVGLMTPTNVLKWFSRSSIIN